MLCPQYLSKRNWFILLELFRVVTPSPVANRHRKLIAALAARHGLPAVYGTRQYVAAGGLISYGPDMIEQYRRAAGYVGSEALAHRRRHVFSW
jgi:hypothetical protein